MGLLVAGARATGTAASWLVTFLGNHPEWKHKAILEVERLLAIYPPQSNTSSLSAHLASIPLEAWEGEAPVLDAVIHETLRIAQPHTAMRRNMGPDTAIDSKTIPSGALVVYPFSDVHLNPDIYPDPWKFDPSREAAKTPFGYLGWGGGKYIHNPPFYVLLTPRMDRQEKPSAWASAWPGSSSSSSLQCCCWASTTPSWTLVGLALMLPLAPTGTIPFCVAQQKEHVSSATINPSSCCDPQAGLGH